MFSRHESRSWRLSWREHQGIGKGIIDFKFWLKLPWPSIVHDGGHSAQISRNLGHLLQILIFWPKNRFFSSIHRATWRALLMGDSFWCKLYIFGFFMENCAGLLMAKRFWQVLGFQKGQKHPKNDLSTPFWTHGSSVGKTHFWRVKWKPNSEIPLVLESR